MTAFIRSVLAGLLVLWAAAAVAQETSVPFGGVKADTGLPVEVTAETLSVDQQDGAAVFEGNVIVGQGEMRMNAPKVRVEYGKADTDQAGKIVRVLASGGVTLVNGEEAAEAETAEYTIDDGKILLQGSVLMTQGQSAISAEQARIDLESGQAVLTGRVRTILQSGGN